MAKIVDPDDLNRNTEIVITPASKTIQLVATGNLSNSSPAKTSGVTLQAVYSKIKELWRTETDLNKMLFPIKMITEVKGDLINGWDWADDTTRQLIRDGGWALRDTSGNLQESYTCIVSLGDVYADTDQAYYQQQAGFDQSSSDFNHTGEVNEAIKVYGDGTHGDYDYRDFLKVFLRVSSATTTQKTHASNNLVVEQDLSTLDYTVYKLPLENAIDIKFTHADSYIAANTPYTGMSIDFLTGSGFTTAAVQSYSIGDVVQDGAGRWARCTGAGTMDAAGAADYTNNGGTATWEAYPGEVHIGSNYYAFNVMIDANNSTNTCTKEEIYEFIQWSLRQTSDINNDTNGDGYGTVNGNVCKDLAYFVGDTLHTYGGVAITDFNANDTNDIVMHDITVDGGGLDSEDSPVTSTARAYPFVAAGTIVFSDNLVNEPDADTKYTMYFENDDAGDDAGNDFDTTDAIVVKDNSGTDITGQITQKNISFDYDYDGNTQRGTGSDGTDAPVVVVAMGKSGAEYVVGYFTITRATGLSFPVNAADERNYSNPA